tara:strand:- start:456 stop:1127 length:672 start_codon:yes stop_codon:yes gene_type:complete
MPGSIKIDDGSGNYTILTNAGSLGSDKTITIPNETATIATTTATNLGGLVKLASATASSSSDLTFDNFVNTSTYSHYIVSIQDLLPATNGVELRFTFREGGASGSDKTGSYAYAYAYNYLDTTSVGESRGTDTDYGRISGNVGNTAGSQHALQIEQQFFSGNGTNSSAILRTPHTTRQANGSVAGFHQWAVTIENLFTCTGLKFYFSSGNIASGTITIFGVKK